MPDLDLHVHGIANGGEGVATDAGGRVVFVDGAIPGDDVRVRLVEERSRFARGAVVEVLAAGDGRIAPPCPHVAEGCGGCGWQHVEPATQRSLKATIVADALRRIGHVADPPPIDPGPTLPATGYRTTVRGLVHEGRFAYRRAATHDPVAADGCLTAHPLVRQLVDEGRFGPAHEVTLRAGVATGERLAVVDPSARDVQLAADVVVVGRDELRRGARAAVHEDVAGRRWRVSARSFFQVRPDGAAALVDVVRGAVEAHLGPSTALVDLYCGVGLFAGALGTDARSVHAVEGDRNSVADARANLADLGDRVTVVRSDVARWHPIAADVVIADPARAGLGKEVVTRLAATGAAVVALVACDPASFGRDAGLLTAAGYRLDTVTLVDLFPQTPHIEVIGGFSRFIRAAGVVRRPSIETAQDLRDLSDAGLVVAISRYHQEALAEAYRRHAGGVFGLARRLLADAVLAEEVVQEIFLRLWERPERFDPDRGSLRSYLLAQCHGRAVDLLRSEGARRRREERELRRAAESGYDLELEVWDLSVSEHLRGVVKSLPEGERQAIELAYFGGHTYREVAAMLDQPEGTVKSRIRSGLRRMRDELVRAGVGLTLGFET